MNEYAYYVISEYIDGAHRFKENLNTEALEMLSSLLIVYSGGNLPDDRREHLDAMRMLTLGLTLRQSSEESADSDEIFAGSAFDILKENFRRHFEKFGLDPSSAESPQNGQANHKGRKPQPVGS